VTADDARRVLLLAHTGRDEARQVARAFVDALNGHGIVVRLLRAEAAALGLPEHDDAGLVELVDGEPDAAHGCELAVVIGGDGSILRAAEITHESGTPVLGVNLGHVGFLAEAEVDHVDTTISAIVDRRYVTEDRLTLDVTVHHDGQLVSSTFALNEASVEKAARERMLEVVLEIDGRPLSRFGCDGVVCATPTGSTAYSFSAGGPVVWPGVEAVCVPTRSSLARSWSRRRPSWRSRC
jgi:NAD+ kinase